LKTPLLWLYAAVVLVGGAAGFWGYQHWARDSQSLRIASATIAERTATSPAAPAAPATAPRPATAPEAAPAASPAIAAAADAAAGSGAPAAKADDHAIPEEVPDLRLPDLEGQPHALRQNGGRPRIYNFWASWCEPCRREIPLLNSLQARYGHTDRLEIIGIAVDFRDAVNDFLKKTRVNYTSLVGEDEGLEAAQSFGVQMALPFSVFADERNHIVAVKVGELHRDEAEVILGQLRALRKGATTLPAARALIAEALKASSLRRAKQSARS